LFYSFAADILRHNPPMTIRKLAPKTQQGYIRTVKDFAAFLGRSPDTASVEDVRRRVVSRFGWSHLGGCESTPNVFDGNERAGSPIRTIGEGHDHHSVATHGPFVAGAGR
jgi:hypothetical protein